MRTPLTLLLCLTAVGCGKNTYQVDSQLQPYVDRFVAESNKVGKPVTVDNLIASIGTIGTADWAGECSYSSTPTITINQTYWSNFNDAEREQVMFHELGHCVLMRNHNNDVDAYGTPVSVMFWEMVSDNTYSQHRGDWMIELFYYDGPDENGSTAGATIN